MPSLDAKTVAGMIGGIVKYVDDHDPKAKERKSTLTMEALKQHTEALAKAEAEAMRGTVGTAKRGYSMSVPGKSKIGGRSATAHRSVARSVAASGVETVLTFRTHKTTREMLVGASVMREIMRSVSPISEPGVLLGKKRRAEESEEDASPERKKKKKKDKKEKKDKKDKKRRELGATALKGLGGARAGRGKIVPRPLSPSHFPMASPTPQPARRAATTQEPSAAPSHWKGDGPSASEDFAWAPTAPAARKKDVKLKIARHLIPSVSVDRREGKPKKKAKKREEAGGRENAPGAVEEPKKRGKKKREAQGSASPKRRRK